MEIHRKKHCRIEGNFTRNSPTQKHKQQQQQLYELHESIAKNLNDASTDSVFNWLTAKFRSDCRLQSSTLHLLNVADWLLLLFSAFSLNKRMCCGERLSAEKNNCMCYEVFLFSYHCLHVLSVLKEKKISQKWKKSTLNECWWFDTKNLVIGNHFISIMKYIISFHRGYANIIIQPHYYTSNFSCVEKKYNYFNSNPIGLKRLYRQLTR